MLCSNCGSKMQDDDIFCSKCGTQGARDFELDDSVSYEDVIFDEDYSDKKVEVEDLGDYEKHYDYSLANELLKKLRKATRNKPAFIAGAAGAVVYSLGHLLSALNNPDLPPKYKAAIIGAIGYIILPFDLIPDMIPIVGYADDVASAALVLRIVISYSTFDMTELDAEIDRVA